MSNPPKKLISREEIRELGSPAKLFIAFSCLAFVFFFMPFLFFLIPIAVIILFVLYKVSESNEQSAKKIAGEYVPGGVSKLDINESIGVMGNALAINDWGIVYVEPAKAARRHPWSDIVKVEERYLGVLSIQLESESFDLNLSIHRYMLIIAALHDKLPGCTNFQIDPLTGASNLLPWLERTSAVWKTKRGRVVLDKSGIEVNGMRMPWNDIAQVVEFQSPHQEDVEIVCHLTFTSSFGQTFVVHEADVSAASDLLQYEGFELVKQIVAERLPGRYQFAFPALTAEERSWREFDRGWQVAKIGLSSALKGGKFDYIESYHRYLLQLTDLYPWKSKQEVQDLYHDYAQVLQALGRNDEANLLLARINKG